MRSKLFFILLACLALLFLNCQGDDVSPEPLFVGDIVLNSQDDVDAIGRKAHVEIRGSLIIKDSVNGENTVITSLAALSTITSISGDLRITGTHRLANLEGLNGLERIGGDIYFDQNEALEEIDALSNVTDYAEPEISLIGNYQLTSIRGLSGVDLAKSLIISENSRLPSLDGLQSLGGVTGRFHFNRVSGITTLNGLSSLAFTGDLEIIGGDMQGLNALSSLDSVGGNLALKYFERLSDLSDLSGLSYVHSLSLESNSSLSNLQGLQSVNPIEGNVSIHNCDALTDLRGLEDVVEALSISVQGNENLSSLEGLNNLEQSLGISLYNNPRLSEISALGKLRVVFDRCGIGNNDQLRSLHGLEALSSVNNLVILDNPVLDNLEALQNIHTLGDVYLADNPNLTTLDAFQGLDKMNRFNASRNANLGDFCGIAGIDIRINYRAEENAFNPTEEDLANGNCRN